MRVSDVTRHYQTFETTDETLTLPTPNTTTLSAQLVASWPFALWAAGSFPTEKIAPHLFDVAIEPICLFSIGVL